MQAGGLAVCLADADHRGEVAVFPVFQIFRAPGRPLDHRLDAAVLQLQLLDPSCGGGLDPFEGLVFIIHHQVNAALGDLGFHRPEALLVHIELALGADDMANRQNGDRFRHSIDFHIPAL